MSHLKYIGGRNLTDFSLEIAHELAKNKVPINLTGSVADSVSGINKEVNDIDMWVSGKRERWEIQVRKVLRKFGFRIDRSWQHWLKLVLEEGGENGGGTTRDVWLDVFFYPLILTEDLQRKIKEGLLLVRVTPKGDGLELKINQVIDIRSVN